MTTKSKNSQLEVDGLQIELVQKRIKNVHIGVYPPEGRIRVSAPLALSQDKIIQSIQPRIDWMRKQQLRFRLRAEQHALPADAGKHLYFLGKRYPLEIVEGKNLRDVVIEDSGKLSLYAKPGITPAQTDLKIKKWYKEELTDQLAPLIESWSKKLNVEVTSWSIKQMKTKWGSCNTLYGKIVFNLELAKHSQACIEYVVAHELIHLLEPSHNERFKRLMTEAIPNWKTLKVELQSIPLTR
jgi:predicted metal-dependent hydrolase